MSADQLSDVNQFGSLFSWCPSEISSLIIAALIFLVAIAVIRIIL